MKETVSMDYPTLNEKQYLLIIEKLNSKGYSPCIDPKDFDTPISIKARFKVKGEDKIRYVEVSPKLQLTIEHSLTKTEVKPFLNKISQDIEESLVLGDIKAEDFELATIQMISKRNPIITPKSEAEKMLFKSLEAKKIFSKAISINCADCNQAFLFPAKELTVGSKAFCKDCKTWFKVKLGKEVYIINEEYMDVMGGLWNKVQKLIKDSWREIAKRGLPMIRP